MTPFRQECRGTYTGQYFRVFCLFTPRYCCWQVLFRSVMDVCKMHGICKACCYLFCVGKQLRSGIWDTLTEIIFAIEWKKRQKLCLWSSLWLKTFNMSVQNQLEWSSNLKQLYFVNLFWVLFSSDCKKHFIHLILELKRPQLSYSMVKAQWEVQDNNCIAKWDTE